MSIRQARPADATDLVELIRQFPTPTPSEPETLHALLVEKLADPRSYLLVAEVSGRLVGYVSGSRRLAFYAGGSTAWIDEILVDAALRTNGTGRALMAAFEEHARADGCKLVALATAGAADFYGKLGYATKAGYFKKYLS